MFSDTGEDRLPVTGWVGKDVFRGFSSATLPCVVPCSSLFSTFERSRSLSFFLFLFSLVLFSWAPSGSWDGVSIAGSSGGERLWQARGWGFSKISKDCLGEGQEICCWHYSHHTSKASKGKGKENTNSPSQHYCFMIHRLYLLHFLDRANINHC